MFSLFLPSLLHSRCALLLRHRQRMNNFSHFKIHRRICSHCLSLLLATCAYFYELWPPLSLRYSALTYWAYPALTCPLAILQQSILIYYSTRRVFY